MDKSLHPSWSFHASPAIISIYLTPLFLTFFSTCSSHLYLGRPLGLFLSNQYSTARLGILPVLILLIWPYHLILLFYISSCILSNFKISLTLVFCMLSFQVFASLFLKTSSLFLVFYYTVSNGSLEKASTSFPQIHPPRTSSPNPPSVTFHKPPNLR